MKTRRTISYVAIALSVITSCMREPIAPDTAVEMSFSASSDSDSTEISSKTYLSNRTVRWSIGDEITLFSSNGSGSKFTANKVDVNLAYFSGSLVPGSEYYAVYPASGSTLNNGEIRATLPSDQTAKSNSFATDANLAIAYTPSASTHLVFKNACALVQVVVRNKNITGIRLEADEEQGNSMTGQAVFIFENDVPVIKSTSGRNYVALNGNILSGYKYYLAVYPGKYSNLKLIFTDKDGRKAVYTNPGVVWEFKRNSMTKIADITIPESKFDENCPIFVKQIASTSSTATIAWTTFFEAQNGLDCKWPGKDTEYKSYRQQDCGKDYYVTLYSDASCTNKLVRFSCDNYYAVKEGAVTSRLFVNGFPPRFTFTGLNASTTYYVKITNRTENIEMSKPFAIKTASDFNKSIPDYNATVGDVVLYESFDKLLFGSDIVNFAAGYSRYDCGALLPASVYSITARDDIPNTADDEFYLARNDVEPKFFTGLANVLEEMGLDQWSTTLDPAQVLVRPGHVKIGCSSKKGSIVTPPLSNLPLGYSATLKISFKASPYTGLETHDPEENDIVVKIIDGGTVQSHVLSEYITVSSKEINLGVTEPGWNNYEVELGGALPTSRIEIASNRHTSGQSRFHLDEIKAEVVSLQEYSGDAFRGTVRSTTGAGINGVVVSDGFNCVTTREDGSYVIPYNNKAEFISVTIPAEYKVAYDSNGFANAYIAIDGCSKRYDFTLTPLIGGKETIWNLCVMADPQARNSVTVDLFRNEVAPDIKAFVQGYSKLYGVMLGDYFENNKSAAFCDSMRDAMKYSCTGVKWWMTIGNHDWLNSSGAASDDNFKKYFGPTRFSVDRGDVHIICINNCYYSGGSMKGAGFKEDEYQWLQHDLQLTDKNKAVVLCVHCPLRATTNYHNGDIKAILSKFKNAYIMSGHAHYNRWYSSTVSGKTITETIHTAASGTYWYGKLCVDGAPNGYVIYTFNGNVMSNYLHKSIGYDKSHQIRCYDGSASISGHVDPYGFQYPKGTIVANVFFGDNNSVNRWKVALYQNGVKCCDMANITASEKKTVKKANVAGFDYKTSSCEISNNYEWFTMNQFTEKGEGKIFYNGEWAGRRTSAQYQEPCFHLWYGKLTNVPSDMSTVKFEVRATDPFGNVYTCSTLTPYQSSGSSLIWRN